ncbi:MAG: ThuA domain-containing protein [Armatimonadota bacterium]
MIGLFSAPKRLLVVSVTKSFRHSSIAAGEALIKDLADRSGGRYAAEYARTEDELRQKLSADGLKAWDTVVFCNTTGELPLPDPLAFVNWVRDGHGFVGVHSASDTFHNFKPYLEMLGGEFKTHGAQVPAACLVADNRFPGLEKAGAVIAIPREEIYLFNNFTGDKVRLLLYLEKHPNAGTPGLYPLAWARQWGRGRVFYTALGHREDVWSAPWFRDHLRGGIEWALGLAKADVKPRPLPQIP